MNSRLATFEINHLPKGGGQFDPPLAWAIPTTAAPGVRQSVFRVPRTACREWPSDA